MSVILLLFEFIVHFGLELFFIFFLKEYYLLQICLAIDIILSMFLYISKRILYIVEVFNVILFFYAFITFDFYISFIWIYIVLKNYIRYLLFYNFFKKDTSMIEENEIDIQI